MLHVIVRVKLFFVLFVFCRGTARGMLSFMPGNVLFGKIRRVVVVMDVVARAKTKVFTDF